MVFFKNIIDKIYEIVKSDFPLGLTFIVKNEKFPMGMKTFLKISSNSCLSMNSVL